jgi:hypothetical protein
MDVYGLCPRRKSGVPVDEMVIDYDDALEVRARCGEYYHATIYEWRAIRCLCIEASLYENELDIDFRGWRFNDGGGLTTQRECDLLAGAIEDLVRNPFDDDDDPFADDPFFGEFYVWADDDGEPNMARPDPEKPVESDYRTTGRDVWMWVAFLRNCGGFAIH